MYFEYRWKREAAMPKATTPGRPVEVEVFAGGSVCVGVGAGGDVCAVTVEVCTWGQHTAVVIGCGGETYSDLAG